jgi:hypothetical protein
MADNSTAYEIRRDLLHLAVQVLTDRHRTLFENEMMKGQDSPKNPIAPYTLEEVLSHANALYDFVKTK